MDDSGMLRTRECAAVLRVSCGFIRGEIKDGRLVALVYQCEGKRASYRVTPEAWRAYVARYWPNIMERTKRTEENVA
jgi:hypothetical protein